MIYTSNSIDIDQNPRFGANCLHFIFKGKFTEEASKKACEIWGQEFDKKGSKENFVLIWDCLKMNDFEFSAKKEWQNNMKSFHDRISKVIVVSNNTIVRGAARLMLKIYSLESVVVKSFDELEENKFV